MLVIDILTRYIWLRALRDKSAVSVSRKLLKIIRDFGLYNDLCTDNSSEFREVNTIVHDLLASQHEFATPYNPRVTQ